ncbi:hypothetical protein Acife_3042 [Acidithiobacillus ferrivorans SS3]|uniref:Uncharacterized protein n=1 Tax=Acidithiobacillus ferrivorans SS3 TaxID=743299 RepID=G0JUE6_9PROT|nr:hypothetical protein [Acidithiobacillus ferrivorans]AEM49115.1 hypothetical protein Acife_3042 [Acidithiobacillus ferrivorans SS3]
MSTEITTTDGAPSTPAAETAAPRPVRPPKRGFWPRFGYPVMVILGILGAGAASFLVQTNWGSFWGHSGTSVTAPGPVKVKVVYIDSGKIMADVIKNVTTNGGGVSHRRAAEIGLAVGQTIQGIANAYAAKGDLVLSQNVLAAPASNNLTAMAEEEVMGRVNAILQGPMMPVGRPHG